jgi:hypothetical protein
MGLLIGGPRATGPLIGGLMGGDLRTVPYLCEVYAMVHNFEPPTFNLVPTVEARLYTRSILKIWPDDPLPSAGSPDHPGRGNHL